MSKGTNFFSFVYFSRGTLPRKRVQTALLGDLAMKPPQPKTFPKGEGPGIQFAHFQLERDSFLMGLPLRLRPPDVAPNDTVRYSNEQRPKPKKQKNMWVLSRWLLRYTGLKCRPFYHREKTPVGDPCIKMGHRGRHFALCSLHVPKSPGKNNIFPVVIDSL